MYDPVRFQKEKSQRAFNWIRVKGFLSLLQEAKARNRAHYFEIFAQWDGHHSLTVPLLRTRFCLWAGETDTRCYNQLVQNPAFLCWKFSKSMVHGSQQSRGSEPELESPAGHAPLARLLLLVGLERVHSGWTGTLLAVPGRAISGADTRHQHHQFPLKHKHGAGSVVWICVPEDTWATADIDRLSDSRPPPHLTSFRRTARSVKVQGPRWAARTPHREARTSIPDLQRTFHVPTAGQDKPFGLYSSVNGSWCPRLI